MAEQILSQDEVEALLSAIKTDEVETGDGGETGSLSERRAESGEAQLCDLTSDDRITKLQMPSLEALAERTGVAFGQSLEGMIRRSVRIHHDGTGPMKMSEFLNYLPVPSCLNLVRLEPLWGVCLLAVEARILYAMLEGFFGGHGSGQLRPENHTFTAIELTFVRKLVALFGTDLSESWDNFMKIHLDYIRTESSPQYAAIVQPEDIVVVTTYNVELPSLRGKIHLAIPFTTLEPYKKQLTAGIQVQQDHRSNEWAQALQRQMGEFVVNGAVDLGKAEMSVRELLSLETGSVIMLDQPADSPLVMEIEGIPKMQGRPVLHRKHVGFMVGELLETEGVGDDGGTTAGLGGATD